jgi:hypothetical protein
LRGRERRGGRGGGDEEREWVGGMKRGKNERGMREGE